MLEPDILKITPRGVVGMPGYDPIPVSIAISLKRIADSHEQVAKHLSLIPRLLAAMLEDPEIPDGVKSVIKRVLSESQ